MIIEQLEKEQIHGNAFHDQPLLNKCHNLIMGSYPILEKIRAIQVIYNIMGTKNIATENDVREYIYFYAFIS